MLEELDERSEQLTAAEKKLAELLTLLMEDFEERHYKLKPAAPSFQKSLEKYLRAKQLRP